MIDGRDTTVTSDVERTIVQPAADTARDQHAHRMVYLGFALMALAVVALASLYFGQKATISNLGDRVDGLVSSSNNVASQAQQLGDQVRKLGAVPVVQPPTPAPDGPVTTQPAPGPTQAQIDDAVAGYLAAHPPAPGASATPAMVATAVGDYLGANPPAPGRAPTSTEIAAAANAYIASHLSDFIGPQGSPGDTGPTGAAGPGPSAQQIADAVNSYCNPGAGAVSPCEGPPGQTGPVGPPVASWTYTDALGVEHTCSRVNTDDTAPTYACT